MSFCLKAIADRKHNEFATDVMAMRAALNNVNIPLKQSEAERPEAVKLTEKQKQAVTKALREKQVQLLRERGKHVRPCNPDIGKI